MLQKRLITPKPNCSKDWHLLHLSAPKLFQSLHLLVFLVLSLLSSGATCANKQTAACGIWWKIWGSSNQPIQPSSLVCTTHIFWFSFVVLLAAFSLWVQPSRDRWITAVLKVHTNTCYIREAQCIILLFKAYRSQAYIGYKVLRNKLY